MKADKFNVDDELLKADLMGQMLIRGSELQGLNIYVEWVVNKLIPRESIILLHGKGGIGKTWLSMGLADRVSKGLPFAGLDTKQMPVIYIDYENSLPMLKERAIVLNASEVLFWHSNTSKIKPSKFDSKDWEYYKQLPQGSLLIIDTCRASHGQDENSSKEMALIMNRLKELRDMGFTIILLHHTPKFDDQQYKGSTVIFDQSDHVLSFHKVKRGSNKGGDDDIYGGNCSYYLGTKDKTRYEPFHTYLDFDPNAGFISAPDTDKEDLESIHALLEEHGRINQSRLFQLVKDKLNIKSKGRLNYLLKKGTGTLWLSEKSGRSVFYLSTCPPINRGDNRTIDYSLSKVEKTGTPNKSQENTDNSRSCNCPDNPETEGTDSVIEVTGVPYEI